MVTPLVKAAVKVERIKRHAAPGRPVWKRAIALRSVLFARMDIVEQRLAMDLIHADRAKEKYARRIPC